jgi:prefoldin subunit 5
MPNPEEEQAALVGAVYKLIQESKNGDRGKCMGENILNRTQEAMGVLFTGRTEPANEQEQVIHDGAKALLDAGYSLSLEEWGSSDKWIVQFDSEANQNDPELQKKKTAVEKAISEGHGQEMKDMTVQMAKDLYIRAKVEDALICIGGGNDFRLEYDGMIEVIKPHREELYQNVKKAEKYHGGSGVIINETEQMQRIQAAVKKAEAFK